MYVSINLYRNISGEGVVGEGVNGLSRGVVEGVLMAVHQQVLGDL